MKAFGIHCVKIALVSLFILEVASFVLMHSLRESAFYKTSLATEKRHSHFDFIIVGSSRGLTSIDTEKLGVSLGKIGYNFSIDDTHIASHVLMVQHLLHQNVQFDTLFLVYENSLDSVHGISTNDYRFLPFASEKYVGDYFVRNNAPFVLRSGAIFPFFALSYYNIELFFPSLFALVKPDHQYRFDRFGDYDYPAKKGFASHVSFKEPVLNFNNRELKELNRICQENNIELVLLLTPNYNSAYRFVGNDSAFSYIDLSSSIKDQEYFYDEIHLNRNGKNLLTNLVIDKIARNHSVYSSLGR